MNSRGTWVVIALLAFMAMASLVVFLAGPGDDVAPHAPPFVAPAPVKGVRADGTRRRARLADETPAADAAPKGPPASLLVRVNGWQPPREGLQPLEGAAVFVIDASGVDWRAVTAAAGAARFDELPAGKTVVHVEVAGRKTRDQTIDLQPGEETEVDVQAWIVGTIRGIVRDPDGRPVDGAWVHAPGHDVLTGDDGSFEIADASYGELTLTAGAPEWGDSEPVGVKVMGDPPSALCELALRRMSSLVVRIVGPSGQPADATVRLNGQRTFVRRGLGEFVVEKLRPGEVTLTADASGLPSVVRQFAVPAGERTEIDVRLEEGSPISGVVVDANGAPVANAHVTAGPAGDVDSDSLDWRTPRSVGGFVQSTRTEVDGTFLLEGLAQGEFALRASGETFASASPVTARAPSSGVRIAVEPVSRVRFRLVGEGAGDNKLMMVSQCAAAAPPNRAAIGKLRVFSVRGAAGLTFEVTVSRSTRALSVCGESWAPVVVAVTPVPGSTVDLGEIRVDAGLSLNGRIVASDGQPVEGVQVSAMLAPGVWRGCVSRDDGTFVLDRLASGPVVVHAFKAGVMGVAVLEVARDAPKADVVVRTAGVLEGVVRDARGGAVARAEVRIRYGFADADDEMGTWRDVKTGGDGRFATPVIAGRCLASAGGAWVSADVAEGGKASVTLEQP